MLEKSSSGVTGEGMNAKSEEEGLVEEIRACGSSREKHRKEHNLLANKDLRLVITRKRNDEITPGAFPLWGPFC